MLQFLYKLDLGSVAGGLYTVLVLLKRTRIRQNSHKIRRQLFGSGSSLQSFFLHYFCCPRSRTFLLLEEIHYVFAWRCFPLLGLELKFFGVNAWVLFLIRLAVQVQAISCKPLSPGWAPALN